MENTLISTILGFCLFTSVVVAAALIIYDVAKGEVCIGLSPDLSRGKRHGVVWVHAANGGVVQQSFLADRPEHLVNPSRGTIRSIFNQLIKMGLYPENIELLVAGQTVVYKYGKTKPIFIQTA